MKLKNKNLLSISLFILRPFQQYLSYVGMENPSHFLQEATKLLSSAQNYHRNLATPGLEPTPERLLN